MAEGRVYYSRAAEEQATREMTRLTLINVAVGLLIGVGLALLMAPSSAQKIRSDVSRTVEEGLNSGQEAVEPLVEPIQKTFGELRKTVADRISSLR